MTREDAESALAAAGAANDTRFPFFEATISCALHESPGRDPEPVRELADEAEARLRQRLKQQPPEEAICEAMGVDLRLSGDLLEPNSPANTDLLVVAERRRGLPAALGVLFLEAGRRCRLQLAGVDFPGHFLLRVETPDGPMALDPFTGGHVVMPSELVTRALRAGLPPSAADDLEHLMRPISTREVTLRLQAQIYAHAIRAGDYAMAERSALRRALLNPSDHRPWLDVAAAREGQGRLAGSLEALAHAQTLDGMASLLARAQRERVRMRLN